MWAQRLETVFHAETPTPGTAIMNAFGNPLAWHG